MVKNITSKITKTHLLGATILLAYFIVANAIFGYASPSMIFIGLPCPACGLTRSGVLFFSGRFAESVRMHPLFIPLLGLAVWAVLCKIFWPDRIRHVKTVAVLLLIASIVVFIIRMVNLFPHTPPLTINSDSILHNILNILNQ